MKRKKGNAQGESDLGVVSYIRDPNAGSEAEVNQIF